MAVLELVKNKQVVAKQSELFEDIRIYRVYNEEDESIVKEERDELSLEIEKNIPEQIIDEKKYEQPEEIFELKSEPIDSRNKNIEVPDGNQ